MNAPNEKELKALDALIAGAMLPNIRCANLSKDELDGFPKTIAPRITVCLHPAGVVLKNDFL